MSKYVVRNCPACTISPNCCTQYHLNNGHSKDCSDISDCLIKRVIDGLKRVDTVDMEDFDRWCFAEQILDMFEIQEVEE